MLKDLKNKLKRERNKIPPFKSAQEAGIDLDPTARDVEKERERYAPENERHVVNDVLKFYKDAQQSKLFLERDWPCE